MPWTKNENGEDVYKPSIFIKEELPTWNELYNEFYVKRNFSASQRDPEDPYWGIPHTLYLLATVCNQLNKMLWEDDKMKEVVELANELMCTRLNLMDEVISVSFVLNELQFNCVNINKHLDNDGSIYIYTFKKLADNPFITNKVRRIVVDDKDCVDIRLVAYTRHESYNFSLDSSKYVTVMGQHCFIDREPVSIAILESMLVQCKEYFSGDRVGWKDIESDRTPTKCEAGVDPAL